MPEELTQDEQAMQDAQDASKVQTTLATAGWTEILQPRLDQYREIYLKNLLSKLHGMDEVVFAQQSVLAIDDLFGFIQFIADEGKQAVDYFAAKEGKSQQ